MPVLSQSNRTGLTLLEGGASNSRPSDKFVAAGRAAGLDTVRYRYRALTPDSYERARAAGAFVHAGGELRRSAAGLTVGVWPDGRGYVEGRLAAIMHGEDDHELLGPELLDEASHRAAVFAGFDGAGALSAGAVGVGRCDVTSELRFADAAEGRALLSAASALDVPWLKTGTEGGKGARLETVFWRTVQGRSIVMRLYDKGVETGTEAPGRWLRLERQKRYRKAREMTPQALASCDLAEVFAGRELRALIDVASDDVVVCGRRGALGEIRRRAATGELRWQTAEQLAGYLALDQERDLIPLRTAQRRDARLRQLGIAIDATADGAVVVPLRRSLREFAQQLAA